MKIGVPKEIKDKENRVALTPDGARRLVREGHEVIIQTSAGLGAGFEDSAYHKVGARTGEISTAWDVNLVLKVKEPQEAEYQQLQGQMVFTYFHLAGVAPSLTAALLKTKTTAVAYETLEDEKGKLPLLAPMSAVAGNMSITMGNYYLAKSQGGKGVQLGNVQGQTNGKVVVIGDGVVGRHAARTAAGMGAKVYIGGRHANRAEQLKKEISDSLVFYPSGSKQIEELLLDADLVIGAVLLAGAKAPYVVKKEVVAQMEPGSVIVDVSIDQGGCIETSRPTSHSDPVYTEFGVTHYCVTNMPGAYPKTSTLALTGATLPYVSRLASKGIDDFLSEPGLAKAINTYKGSITYHPVAEALGMMPEYNPITE